MNPLVAIAFLVGLVAVTTLVGFRWRSRQGAARAVAAQPRVDPAVFAPRDPLAASVDPAVTASHDASAPSVDPAAFVPRDSLAASVDPAVLAPDDAPAHSLAHSPGPVPLGTPDAPASAAASARFGTRATLVQFSTEFCSGCPATRRVLTEISTATPGVAYLDVDVTHRADLVREFAILQTPTTLILDGDGVVRTRIGGVVRRAVVETRLKELA